MIRKKEIDNILTEKKKKDVKRINTKKVFPPVFGVCSILKLVEINNTCLNT